jgi:anti-sigma regulatory factor (Ser/Thr protein kinase)
VPSAPLPPSINTARESGFGLYMLSKSVDEVSYYRDERGRNCVALAKYSKSASANESEM